MILHIARLDKFIPTFIEFVNAHFDIARHRFWLIGDSTRYPYVENKSIYHVKSNIFNSLLGSVYLVRHLHKADKVILHSFSSDYLIAALAAMPWLLKKCHWVIWGDDLYQFNFRNQGVKRRVREVFRRFVIKRLGHLVTYLEGDIELARKWYGAKGRHHQCLMYTSNLYKEVDVKEKKDGAINIQVGNSADSSNRHVEVFEKLLPYKNENIRIFVPLSYGDQRNADYVIAQGKKWFGDKFYPLTEFMVLEDYLEFLGTIDIALFNHRRQQGMGNTIALLGLGKIVYMRTDVVQWHFFKNRGIRVFSLSEFNLTRGGRRDSSQNVGLVKSYFSTDTLYDQLGGLFS